MKNLTFLPLLTNTVSGYVITLGGVKDYDNGMACASFNVILPDEKRLSVELYFPTDAAPLPVAYGRNGCEGGELSFYSGWRASLTQSGKREAVTALQDFDGAGCLPKSVCAVLRAHGLTVPDDCLASPL